MANGNGGLWHKGALGSPWQKETYGNTGKDPGSAQYDNYGPKIGPGTMKGKVTAEIQRQGSNGKK